jgi:guanylate kinase
VLVDRLTGRGTESRDVVERRLQTAKEELAARSEFNVEVVNDDVHRAAEDLLTLIVGTPRDLHA